MPWNPTPDPSPELNSPATHARRPTSALDPNPVLEKLEHYWNAPFLKTIPTDSTPPTPSPLSGRKPFLLGPYLWPCSLLSY